MRSSNGGADVVVKRALGCEVVDRHATTCDSRHQTLPAVERWAYLRSDVVEGGGVVRYSGVGVDGGGMKPVCCDLLRPPV